MATKAPKALQTPKGCRSIEVAAADGSRWQVLVGKTAQDNDRLSLEHGQPHEAWLHVAELAGAHVVVRFVPSPVVALAAPRPGTSHAPASGGAGRATASGTRSSTPARKGGATAGGASSSASAGASATQRRPPRDVLKKAAGICAFYSKAKTKGLVPVHLTTCGNVSKRPGAPAGQVELKRGFEVLSVAPLEPASARAGASAAAAPQGQKPR